MTRRGADPGYVTLFTAGVALGVVSVVGLVLDGGRALRAQSDSFGAAAAAARVGAQELDPVASVAGEVRLDDVAAGDAARRFLADRGLTGTVTVTDTQVRVTVVRDVDFAVLPGSARLDATATSRVTRERAPS
ncbi:MAG TPA: pilus assembly protein TadG-related protein [Acidimicrobiales bacterium]|nr:pilus assembly protein TadG-related protein [Acidimicrobiales bacterium]